ncbi:hypothetical protein NX784_00955 [Massilia pinisoli]|uniref:Cupin domain-containing protein n=1 Tax=Massilia pinisoli TaxID=1772194 RepID=A0ABT1ZJR9_9BURK|nr:hypothetical protein [Massilia pinisoli]MCS0580152.1 hypothetical protein [Massilia pinisoli]
MTLQPGEEIGLGKHEGHDQVIRVEAGRGGAILDGTEHNVLNTSDSEPMRLCTLYSPPEHLDGTVHATRADADEYETSTATTDPQPARA